MPNDRPPPRRSAPPVPKTPGRRSAPPPKLEPPPKLPRIDVPGRTAKPSISMHRVNSMVFPAVITPKVATARYVLVADDDDHARRLTVRALRTLYTVYEVTDAEQALRVLKEASAVDCAVISMQLPGIGGVALARQVRSDPKLRSVPVVFLTASASPTLVAEGISVGVRHILRKPLKVKDLVDVIGALIRGS